MSAFILVGSFFMYYKATQLRVMQTYETVGPDFWPKVILVGMIALSGYLTVRYAVLLKREMRAASPGHEPVAPAEAGYRDWVRVGVTTLFILVYIYLLKPLGFMVASPIFIIAMMLYINPRKRKIIPVGVLGILAVIYLLFGKLLYIPLPRGHGVFRQLSLFWAFDILGNMDVSVFCYGGSPGTGICRSPVKEEE